MRMPQLMRRKPTPHASVNGKVALQLRPRCGGGPRAAAGRALDHAEQRPRRERRALGRPVGQGRPCPGVDPDLATPVTLPVPDEQAPSPLVEVGLGEREGLVDPNARAPQHNDQTPHPPAVTAISGLAHDRDDLVDRGRIGGVTASFVRRDSAGVMAGHRRRGPRAAGGVQQLMSRHGSLLWRADWFAVCSNRPGPERVANSAAAAYPAGCGSDAISPPHRPNGQRRRADRRPGVSAADSYEREHRRRSPSSLTVQALATGVATVTAVSPANRRRLVAFRGGRVAAPLEAVGDFRYVVKEQSVHRGGAAG